MSKVGFWTTECKFTCTQDMILKNYLIPSAISKSNWCIEKAKNMWLFWQFGLKISKRKFDTNF